MRILVLQHIACEHPGAFSEVIGERGVEAVAVELDEGEALPDWREFDAVLAMGGPMGAGDDAEHRLAGLEKRLVRDAVEAGGPSSASASACSCSPRRSAPAVYPARAGRGRPAAGRADRGGPRATRSSPAIEEPLLTLQWHGDTFDLPDGAVRLASSPMAQNQAFRGARGLRDPVPPRGDRRDGREWAEIPAYRRSLAATLGEAGGAAFLAEVERRAGELHPAARRCSPTGSSSLRTGVSPAALCTFLFKPRI